MDWRVQMDVDGSELVRSLSHLDWLLLERSHCGRRLTARPAGRNLRAGVGGMIEIVTAAYPYAVGLGDDVLQPSDEWFEAAESFAVVVYGQRQLYCFRHLDDAVRFGRCLR